MAKTPKLTQKERRFVDAFLGSCNGNGSEAAIAAGYAPGSARVTASRLLTKANIKAAVDARNAKAEEKSIASADERDKILSGLARLTEPSDRAHIISAIKELNKCSGRHSIKHVLDVTEKLSDIIAASRRPAPAGA